MSDESLRLAHAAACDRERESTVAPQYVPVSLPVHADEIWVAHESSKLPTNFSVAEEAL